MLARTSSTRGNRWCLFDCRVCDARLPVHRRGRYNQGFPLLLGGRSTVGHVALDHVIGVRIPASQPITATRRKSLCLREFVGSIPVPPYVRPLEQPPGAAANLYDFSSLARTRRVRIPHRSCTTGAMHSVAYRPAFARRASSAGFFACRALIVASRCANAASRLFRPLISRRSTRRVTAAA